MYYIYCCFWFDGDFNFYFSFLNFFVRAFDVGVFVVRFGVKCKYVCFCFGYGFDVV